MRPTRHALVLVALFTGLAGLAAVPGAVRAGMIGINVGSDRQGMAAGDVAGVVAQGNWNQAPLSGSTSGDNSGGTTMNISGPTAGAIVDSTGAVVAGISVSWYGDKSNRTWSAGNSFAGTGDAEMMTGYLDSGWGGYNAGNENVTVSGLPSSYTTSGYDIYVYVRGGGGAVQLNATSATSTPEYYLSAISSPSSYVLATSTTSTSPAAADYVEFAGQSAGSFTVSAWGAPYIAGVQIVQENTIPEPAYGLLLTLVAAGLVLGRGGLMKR